MLPRSLQPAMGRIRKLFEDTNARLTPHDVAAKVFIDVRNAREYLKILKDEGAIYIHSFCRGSSHGKWVPIYSQKRDEDDRDAPKPNALTINDYRRRQRAVPEKWQHELKGARVRRAARKFATEGIRLDPLLAALTRDVTMPGS